MTSVFFARKETWVLTILLILAALVLSFQITQPLVDYDEATYARYIVDTLKSGDLTTMSLAGQPRLEKPPLYFWAAMPFTAVFGPQEWTFRVPSVVASMLCLLLTYLIVRRLQGSVAAAAASLLILLFSADFFLYASEVRMDSGVVAAILAAFYFFIRGWQDERYLLWFFPIMAIGFLTKSVIIFLVIPIALIYSVAYKEWQWLRSRHLWLGTIIAATIFAPWHLYELWRFGGMFWQTYFVSTVRHASDAMIGNNNLDDYVRPLWTVTPLWFWPCLGLILAYLGACVFRGRALFSRRKLAAPLASVFFLLVFFTASKSHLSPYMMPAYPFLAMFAGMFADKAMVFGKRAYGIALLAVLLILSGAYYRATITWESSTPTAIFVEDEKAIGENYRAQRSSESEPLYSIGWPFVETMNFYGDTLIHIVSPRDPTTTGMKAPFFMVMKIPDAQIMYEQVPQIFEQMRIVYQGQYLVLLHSDQDLVRSPW